MSESKKADWSNFLQSGKGVCVMNHEILLTELHFSGIDVTGANFFRWCVRLETRKEIKCSNNTQNF
jgi:hypothetical protein